MTRKSPPGRPHKPDSRYEIGIASPSEMKARLLAGARGETVTKPGDPIVWANSADGATNLPKSAEFERQIAVARKVMRKHRDILRALGRDFPKQPEE